MMKKLLIVSIVVIFASCTKEKVRQIGSSNSHELRQTVYGNVKASSGYMMLVYEDLGDGTFTQTTSNFYSNNEIPHTFLDTISNPFYFYIELHNTSLFLNNNKGDINVDIYFDDEKIITLTADSTIEVIDYTSIIYNN